MRHQSTVLRQHQIVAAALACFTEKGIEQTAIGDICRRAGVSVGSVYHHFGNKEALAGVVYCEAIRSFQAGYVQALSGAGEARLVITALVGYHLDWVATQPMSARYLLQTRSHILDARALEELAQQNATFLATMASWFAAQVQAGHIRRLPRELYVALLVGPCQEWARSFLKGEVDPPDAHLRQAFADCIWRSLCGPNDLISTQEATR